MGESVTFIWPETLATVLVAGDFNSWKGQALQKSEEGQSLSVFLKPGRYQYKFIVDGRWKVDETKPIVQHNGNKNNVVSIAIAKDGNSTMSGIPKPVVQGNEKTEERKNAESAQSKANVVKPSTQVPKAAPPVNWKYKTYRDWLGLPETSELPSQWKPFLGAVPVDGGVHFRVWSTNQAIEICVDRRVGNRSGHGLLRLNNVRPNLFEGVLQDARPGDRYRVKPNPSNWEGYPDPVSRLQPEGVQGWSEIVDPRNFTWSDHGWKGIPVHCISAVYEMHIGTFTQEGTYLAAADKLHFLKETGINVIQIMPQSSFAGWRNWGYGGVLPFAPPITYGRPDDLRQLVERAHSLGMAVIIDVVYNHFGPEGNYFGLFVNNYIAHRHKVPWGHANDLGSDLRFFMIENALYWVHEFHADGLRIDSAHNCFDDSARPMHFLKELCVVVRESAARAGRQVILVAENFGDQVKEMYQPSEKGGYGFDSIYSDHFYHEVTRLAIRSRESQPPPPPPTKKSNAVAPKSKKEKSDESPPDDTPAEEVIPGKVHSLVSTIRKEYEFVDAAFMPQDMVRFLTYFQNHDMVGNRAVGDRLWSRSTPASYRTASALLLCLPHLPLLFMGQEWGASTPFMFFTNHDHHFGRGITEGRKREFAHDPEFREHQDLIPDPQAESTFRRSKLDWNECLKAPHAGVRALHKHMLHLRSSDPCMLVPQRSNFQVFALSDYVLAVLRRAADDSSALLFVASLGPEESNVNIAAPEIGAFDVAKTVLEFTTEDQDFCGDGKLRPVFSAAGSGPAQIRFLGPALVCLRLSKGSLQGETPAASEPVKEIPLFGD
mmetsp:Transcript_23536/g.38672  ORF Transcript_23536/g.38672 Transcript_23536/m.38672 type:complete len:828 (-) Transcript_23536:774-3257(-)